jgi:trehalose 6-phosphate synthase
LSRLVVVSNRIAPIKHTRTGGEGGLAVAVQEALSEQGGLWFGWSGVVAPDDSAQRKTWEDGKVAYATVDLPRRDYEEYYNGFANRTLWPLFHYRLDLTEFSRRDLAGYLRVNGFFARQLLPLLGSDDLIWVHDYHLIPLAEQLRHADCRQLMGFFLHIPWPSLGVLLALPNHRNIVEALFAYDLVGFQTEDDLWAFRDYIVREAGGQVLPDGTVSAYGRKVQAQAFPIGIDSEAFAAYAEESAQSRLSRRLVDSLGGRQLIIGVDRLDYSKGLIERMAAMDCLLKNYPENRGHLVMLQIAPRSRSDVPEYGDIQHELEAIAGRVNGRYAEFDWVPIRYMNKGHARRTLAGFYRVSQVGIVTPLRDGMNLVAKEFVAAQSAKDPGVLVLSRFAGAARELDGAIIVNPYDVEGIAAGLQEALTMPLEQRRARWEPMAEGLRKNDATAWRKSFLAALSASPSER